LFLIIFLFVVTFNTDAFAACSGTLATWGGGVTTWNTATNWSPATIPNANTFDVVFSSGTATANLTTSVGCVNVNTPGLLKGSLARTLTVQGDSITSNTSGGLSTWTALTLVLGPHKVPATAQSFTFNQNTTMFALTVASSSVPGAGLFGATITNLNAAAATFTTLANTGLNSSQYVGKITATTYTNTKANSLDVTNGTLTTNAIGAANTVTGGSLNVNSGGTFVTTATFNPVAGFTTTVDNGAPKGILTVTTTSAPAGTLNIDGTMTTTQFNPTATSTSTISSTGTITASTSSTPLGIINVAGSISTPLFNPGGTSNTTINTGGLISATTSSTPGATSVLSITGTLTTPIFNPVSGASITVNSGGNLNATTSSTPGASITVASGGTATIGTYSPASTSTTNVNGHMIVTTFTPAAGSTINVNNGGVLDITTFTPTATTNITVAAGGTLNITTMTGTLAATVNISGTATVTNLPSISTGILDIKSGGKLIFTNGVTLTGATLKVEANGTLEIADTKTITLSSGNFQVLGTSDTFPQNIATKGKIQAPGAGTSYNFTTTGGTLSLTGFNFDRIGVNGLNIGGTTIVSALAGGQFTNLSTTYASVKAIQINTSGAIPVSAPNIAWNWGAFNVFSGTTPLSTDGYKLISSAGCSSHAIDFTGWTGDWYEAQPTFDVTTVIATVGTCTISLSSSTSAVSVLSFDAVPFNAAIDLRWRTDAERNHMGFNVYRSDIYSAQFQQINKSLLRNLKNSSQNQASYRFVDQNVTNGQTYYYYIEDVDTFGKKTMHGPVSATALATLGNPPADNANENSDTNPNDPINNGGSNSPAPIPNPSYENLGNGIVILSKTNKSIRLEITPADPLFSTSSWNNTYEDVAIAGYSKMTLVGSPELPEKDILIEVPDNAVTAKVNNEAITQKTLAGHLITPAPNYALSTGILIPGYSPNQARYADSNFYPMNYYSVQSDLVSTNHSKFLKVKINPLKLNPVTNTISMASKIVLDIGLDGDDWDVTTPDDQSEIGPYAISNTLRINVNKSGVYQLNYADFVNSGVEGPFINKNVNNWRLYFKDVEIPLEITSSTGLFSAGDTIRFYVPFTKEIESKNNQLILSPVSITSSTGVPKRIESLDANPAGQPVAIDVLTKFTKTIEQNLTYVDGITLNDNLDHFFYASLVNFAGMDTLSTTVSLPEIDVNNPENVSVEYYVRGRLGMKGNQIKHSVSLSIAGTEEEVVNFDENERQVLSFSIPANHFIAGNNELDFKVLGTFAPGTDNDFVLVDKVEISYNGYRYGNTGVSTFSLVDSMKVFSLAGFPTNQIVGYDITIPLEPKKLTNIAITSPDGGATFESSFFVNGDVDSDNLKHFAFVSSPSIFKPEQLSLNPGIITSLKSASNHADLIIYGDENLIMAAQDLIDRRISQGLEVMTVTPEQVYAEFSYGVQKSKALKDFMNTALNNWTKAPRFLLILGDGTFDPLDYNVGNLPANQRSVLEKGTLPAPLIPGRFIDFSSDNYFISTEQSHLPRLSVGRLPTNDPEKIKAYSNKIKNYEEGDAAPTNYVKKITFFADSDTGNYEHFNSLSKAMMTTADGFTTNLYDKTELGSGLLVKEKITSEFNSGPLMISMLGHGAFDRFGDNIFNTTDAAQLNNSVLPIVVVWNCESAYFYDADNTYKSLGEELIFNPNGGAIVYMGSTTQTTPPAQSRLAQNFFSQLSAAIKFPAGDIRFGDLIYHAKLGVGDGAYEKDIVNSFSIIGDPTLVMPAPLFPAEAFTTPPVSKGKSMFGCTASAADGGNTPWHEGFLEWAIYMLLIVFGTKLIVQKVK
jgi:hypothetical protein